MAYSHGYLAELVRSELVTRPTATLTSIAGKHRISRHTLERAIRNRLSCSFRELRSAAIATGLRRVAGDDRAMSIKEIAATLGYAQTRSLGRTSLRQFGCSTRVAVERLRLEQA